MRSTSTKSKTWAYAPRHTFDDAIAQTVNWYQTRQDWWRAIRDGADYRDYYARQIRPAIEPIIAFAPRRFALQFTITFRYLLLLLFLGAGAARADVIPWNFGSPVPLDAKRARNVRLESEQFRAQIYYDYATAQATYRFRNAGAATSVAMAFAGEEPRGEADVRGASYLRVRVDGKRVAFRRETKGKMFSAVTRYLGRVRFERGQTRTMQVEIRTQKFWSLLFDADLEYAFAGPEWKGTTRSEIGIELRAPGTFIVSAFRSDSEDFDLSDAVSMQTQGAQLRFQSDKKLKGFLVFSLTATVLPQWLTRDGSENRYEQTVVVPGAAQGLYQAGFWAPPALIKNGVTYLQIDDLAEYYSQESSKIKFNLTYDDATNRATLNANGHQLQVVNGSTDARLDGRAFRLRAAPFFATSTGHDQGSVEVLYAPLTDIARALGAQFNVNRRAHRFYFSLPSLNAS